MTVTLESIPLGYRVWGDKIFLLANIETKHDKGLVRDGTPIMEAMPEASWHIHFTSPHQSLDVLRAIVLAIPATA